MTTQFKLLEYDDNKGKNHILLNSNKIYIFNEELKLYISEINKIYVKSEYINVVDKNTIVKIKFVINNKDFLYNKNLDIDIKKSFNELVQKLLDYLINLPKITNLNENTETKIIYEINDIFPLCIYEYLFWRIYKNNDKILNERMSIVIYSIISTSLAAVVCGFSCYFVYCIFFSDDKDKQSQEKKNQIQETKTDTVNKFMDIVNNTLIKIE